MTVEESLQLCQDTLSAVGIGTARLDSLILLEYIARKDRAWLLANPTHQLTASKSKKLTNVLKQRADHIPIAYLLGRTEFYGRNFVITPAVLEPRPESETMIDLLKSLLDLPPKPAIADVGTGSGALGITAKLELPDASVELLEIDSKALEVAKKNVDLYTIDISVIKSDLLAQSNQQNDLLLCNLPYVPDEYHINEAASQEPRIAIFGGPDGLDVYRNLFKQVRRQPHKPLYILSESLPPQHTKLAKLAMSYGYQLVSTDDFIQCFKIAD